MYHSLALALSLSVALAPLPVLAANVQDPSTMSDDEKMEMAKQLYGEGDAAINAGDAATALAKFEEAYNTYAPSLHVFNINIGLAAYELGDCMKAKTAFQRFLDLVPDHPARAQAQEKLLEIERSKCAEQQAATAATTTTTSSTPISADYENEDAPELTSRRTEREEAIETEREETDSKRASGKLIAGAALTGVGVVGIIGGAVSLGIANKRANELATLASPGPTGFPEGDYSDDDVANLDRSGLPAANTASVVLFVAGGVLTTVGVTLIVLDRTSKKKAGKPGGDKNASKKGPRLTSVGPTMWRGGAGAAATVRF
ncbi:MAG: tetratricopeptide repeat protein [Myxococcales bacterium]|nr:tetratricopeptide repeat protein [Myxococcales bacterium]MCB9713525.1 tetratricopeptide repeat protein [Myxococcales bacterium]